MNAIFESKDKYVKVYFVPNMVNESYDETDIFIIFIGDRSYMLNENHNYTLSFYYPLSSRLLIKLTTKEYERLQNKIYDLIHA